MTDLMPLAGGSLQARESADADDGRLMLVDRSLFFDLVDEVLVSVGRARLGPAGPQRAIIDVTADDRVLQILAGAGSGKTEMLIWRVLFELFVLGTDARRLMVTTFTRKAATELSVRVVERSDALIERARLRGITVSDPHVHDLRIGTLHSLCDTLLAEFDPGYMAAGTEVIDEIETCVRLIRVHRNQLGFGGQGGARRVIDRLLDASPLVALFRAPWDDNRWPSSTFDRVSWLMALLAQQVETWFPRCADPYRANGIESVCGILGLTDDLVKLAQRWEEYLDGQHILDFVTIQKRFLERQDTVAPYLDHVFVDEFQDTNPIQFAIHTGWLARPGTRLTVVGDDDQAVYRFRGSDIGCFADLGGACHGAGAAFRLERLEENWRSTGRIIRFTEAFRRATVLASVSMPKTVQAPETAPLGDAPRLLAGPWTSVCGRVAEELDALGVGRPPAAGTVPPTAAILLFSTSEKETTRWGPSPALELRRQLEARGLRVYNPRNKTAAHAASPVFQLAALLSYLIDPVVKAPAGKNGQLIEVWGSNRDPGKASFAPTVPPDFFITSGHADIQKKFLKQHGGIGSPGLVTKPLLDYLDRIRELLITASDAHRRGHGAQPRLTLSGLVARLLQFDYFRDVGFTPNLFREALFTQLLEANIAATRLTMRSLDRPLQPELSVGGKVVWPAEMWSFLNIFGTLVKETDLDDVEVDAFAEHAVALLTFHQAKGLEFDHVYVGLTGRNPAPNAVLRTMLFSGDAVSYNVDGEGQPTSEDPSVRQLSLADREREVYVAITRAKAKLTILHDPNDTRSMTPLNPGLAALFDGAPTQPVAGWPDLSERSHTL
jgi:DNA helicase-2/ATP-dependent DNA helicase PcrA